MYSSADILSKLSFVTSKSYMIFVILLLLSETKRSVLGSLQIILAAIFTIIKKNKFRIILKSKYEELIIIRYFSL